MPNYGEDIAYWYLRLNGFFPIANLVVHGDGNDLPSGDIDLIALRPPHVFEPVGGSSEDCDPFLLEQLNFSHLLGIICEVKTGRYEPDELFPGGKLAYAVGRLGLLPEPQRHQVVQSLGTSAVATEAEISVAKLAVLADGRSIPGALCLSLDAARRFLQTRVDQYPLEKYRDRMYLPNGVFQYLAGQVPRPRPGGRRR